ncbi:MAG: DUF1501 domain-containing protein [Planctomycetaceae bacterium]
MTSLHPSTDVARRRIIQAGGLGLLGLGLPELLAGRTEATVVSEPKFGQAKSCILLFMWGGPAHQDTWDLKPAAPREIRGEFAPIPTRVPGIQISEHFPLLAERTDQLAIIRSMTHGNVDHLFSTHFLLTGQPPPPIDDLSRDWPSLGSVLAKLGRGREPLPPYVSMRPKLDNDVPRFVEQSHGQFAGWLGSAYDPLSIDADPSRADYRVGEFELPKDVLAARLDERHALLHSLDDAAIARCSPTGDDAPSLRPRLRAAQFGRRSGRLRRLAARPDACANATDATRTASPFCKPRRLVERGVPLVTVFWPSDGIKNVSVYWDTHSRNFIDLKQRLMPVADQAFTARSWTTFGTATCWMRRW